MCARADGAVRSLKGKAQVVEGAPANNPLKLPFFVVVVLVGVALLVVGAGTGSWALAIIGALDIAAAYPAIRSIRRGENPWWIRSPLDRWWTNRRQQDRR